MGRDRRSRSRSPKRRRSRSRSRERRKSRDRLYEKRSVKTEVKDEDDFDRRQDDARMRRNRLQTEQPKNENMKREPGSPETTQNIFADALRGGDSDQQWGLRGNDKESEKETKPKQKPNLGLSGALTAETNTYKGHVIKYSEPPEAKVPKKKWRLYPFKGDEALKVIYLHRQSAYMIGRLTDICEIPVEHPSCSKQHAAIQFRAVKITKESGRDILSVRPYIIDLESSNGTYLNNSKIEAKRYYELKERDVIKFGFSTREYVVLHDKSDTAEVHKSSSDDEASSDDE